MARLPTMPKRSTAQVADRLRTPQILRLSGSVAARIDGGEPVDLTLDPATIAGTLVSFGTGAPVAAGVEGSLYFDTTGAPYVGYVYHASAWHMF